MYLYFINAPIMTSIGLQTEPLVINLQHGRIVAPPQQRHSRIEIDCTGYTLLPGLINAHDHLELNHFPRTRFRDQYPNAHQWGEDVSQHLDKEPYRSLRQSPLAYRCWVGGIKNLLSGVSTVLHHNPYYPPFKHRDFPVEVVRSYQWAHSLHFSSTAEIQRAIDKSNPNAPFFIHLAEGTDAIAAAEYQQLASLGGVCRATILVHGVGLLPEDQHHAVEHCGGLVWCPSSNNYLLGHSAKIKAWAAAQKLLLGSDSRLTADGDLLDELRAAYQSQEVDAETLFQSVTDWPARRLSLRGRGSLTVGALADVVAIPNRGAPYQDLIQCQRRDIGLVLRAGRPRYGDAALIKQFRTGDFAPLTVDDTEKWISKRIKKRIERYGISI